MARIVRDPLYKQVTDALVELIDTEFSPGDRFLSEREVSDRFEISRTTANKVLSNLVIEGVIEFRRGVGTFVRRPRPNVNLRRLVSFTEKARAAGFVPQTHVVSFREVSIGALTALPVEEVADSLGADRDTPVYEAERVRRLDGRPVIYERRALRSDLCPGLSADELDGSLYTLLLDRFALQVESVTQRIGAHNASPSDAAWLEVPVGDAVLVLTSVGYVEGDAPLWYERTLYHGGVYEFVNRLHVDGDVRQSAIDASPHQNQHEDIER
jgi:GntR family transcriptional regulator